MVVPRYAAEQKAFTTLLNLARKDDMDFLSLCCIHQGKESVQEGR